MGDCDHIFMYWYESLRRYFFLKATFYRDHEGARNEESCCYDFVRANFIFLFFVLTSLTPHLINLRMLRRSQSQILISWFRRMNSSLVGGKLSRALVLYIRSCCIIATWKAALGKTMLSLFVGTVFLNNIPQQHNLRWEFLGICTSWGRIYSAMAVLLRHQ